VNELLASRFQELYNSPNSNMLESKIGAREEPMKVGVHATFGLIPYVVKSGVVLLTDMRVCSRFD
jgi:hypothetical protein